VAEDALLILRLPLHYYYYCFDGVGFVAEDAFLTLHLSLHYSLSSHCPSGVRGSFILPLLYRIIYQV